jgi:hypothetical protein
VSVKINSSGNPEYSGANQSDTRETLGTEIDRPLLFLHPGVSIRPADAALMETALNSLPSGAVVIARVFQSGQPHQVLNAGYWRGQTDTLWRSITLGETSLDDGRPELEPAYRVALGAVLMNRETAERVGAYDVRFATHLADVDWLNRAQRLGVPCFVVRNARALADPSVYPSHLGNRYPVVRDGLLLARKQGGFWPWHVFRLFFWLVSDVWRPFDFSLSTHSGASFLKRLVWSVSNYASGLRKRVLDVESKATLAAIRDFLLNRFERV